MLRNEVRATIAKPEAVPVPCDPREPYLFPLFQQVETFMCFGCIERRLGRQLTQEDLNSSVWNAGWIDHVDGIVARNGATASWFRRGRKRHHSGRGLPGTGPTQQHSTRRKLIKSTLDGPG